MPPFSSALRYADPYIPDLQCANPYNLKSGNNISTFLHSLQTLLLFIVLLSEQFYKTLKAVRLFVIGSAMTRAAGMGANAMRYGNGGKVVAEPIQNRNIVHKI